MSDRTANPIAEKTRRMAFAKAVTLIDTARWNLSQAKATAPYDIATHSLIEVAIAACEKAAIAADRGTV